MSAPLEIQQTGRIYKLLDFLSMGLFYLSVLLILISFISVGFAWYNAFRDGMIPEVWGKYEGNHGPWNHYHKGGDLIGYALTFQLYSVFLAVFSALIKKSRVKIWCSVISTVIFFTTLYFLFWLID